MKKLSLSSLKTGGILTKKVNRTTALLTIAAALTGSLVYAGVLASSNYIVTLNSVTNGGSSVASSTNYSIQAGALGQNVSGGSHSPMFASSGGFTPPTIATPAAVPANVSDVYVYPNPFKPNSPGRFQSASSTLTFKHLPATATIKIFAITGKLVAELHKTDAALDYYPWDVKTSYGEKLGSGVYIFYVTAPNGGKAKGKFAVIR